MSGEAQLIEVRELKNGRNTFTKAAERKALREEIMQNVEPTPTKI